MDYAAILNDVVAVLYTPKKQVTPADRRAITKLLNAMTDVNTTLLYHFNCRHLPTEMPEACSPIFCIDWIIADAIWGPLRNNQRKRPKNMMKRINSAKKSPMSALRRMSIPPVQARLMVPSVQNSQVAAFITADCQLDARVANSVTTWSSMP